MPSGFSFGSNAPVDDQFMLDKTGLGGKGANLAEMARIGLPVPPGFTSATSACLALLSEGQRALEGLRDSASIAFCEKVGLDYVSASPLRVPIARLATAQATLAMYR